MFTTIDILNNRIWSTYLVLPFKCLRLARNYFTVFAILHPFTVICQIFIFINKHY